MIPECGLLCLIMGFMVSTLVACLPAFGFLRPQWVVATRHLKPLCVGQSLFVLFSFVTLVYCFSQDDFSVEYIAQHSHTHLPWGYKLCAIWGAHEGSLLLWSLLLVFWMSLFLSYSKKIPEKLTKWTLCILSALHAGFLFLLLESSNPFARILPYFPTEGLDLNPLLQDPGFVLHPPFLYFGYVGLAVPFAILLAALIIQDRSIAWYEYARPFALLSWGLLTIGITLGSWWAYYELGWGGWWFWDPVENASLMPWLLSSALVHALYMLSKKRLFESWTQWLVIATFVFSLVGTFLVRSGVLSSVHAFASDPKRGMMILMFMGSVIIISLALYLFRAQHQKSEITGLFSKGSLLLLGNVLLLVSTLSILLGTLYPLLMDVLFHKKMSVGPPYFNSVFLPIMLPLIILMIITPFVSWEGVKLAFQRKYLILFVFLMIVGLWTGIGILLGSGLILSTIINAGLQLKNNKSIPFSRWGMLIAHTGLGILIIGVSIVSTYEIEKEFSLAVGEKIQVAGYELSFIKLEDSSGSNYESKKGTFTVSQANRVLCHAYPEKRLFTARDSLMTETAICASLRQDFYIALGEALSENNWSIRFYIKPFIRGIWLGALLIALGAILSGICALSASTRIVAKNDKEIK